MRFTEIENHCQLIDQLADLEDKLLHYRIEAKHLKSTDMIRCLSSISIIGSTLSE
jgi:hypothetical protein